MWIMLHGYYRNPAFAAVTLIVSSERSSDGQILVEGLMHFVEVLGALPPMKTRIWATFFVCPRTAMMSCALPVSKSKTDVANKPEAYEF